MFKKGLFLTIIFLLIFSIGGFATDYKYTQESGTGFFVGTADKADALEDSNELRQIINDLGALLVHSKMDGLYPKDLTTGGTLQIPEAGLKFSNAPVNDDIAAYIAGEMTWQTKSELSIQPLDTALTNISALVYVSPSLIKLTAEDTYAVRTLAEIKTDLSLNNVTNVATDDTAYNATSWDANNDAATKNAIRDKIEAMGGYTNLTSFVDQTAWRLFYSNTDGDVVELALGADGTYLMSNGAAVAPTFETPAGGGTVTTSGTPVDDDYAKFTNATTIEGRSYAEMKTDLAYQLSDMSDVGVTTPTDKYVLVADGDSWESRALVEADISDLGSYATLTGDEVLTNKDINFVNALGTDHFYSGEVDSQPVGESVVFGDLLYFNWTDKEWKKTDADAAATMPGLRIALESKADGETCLMLVKGYIRDDSAFEFAGSMVYTSVTPGAMSSTAPTETGDQIQRVGVAKSADILFFDPSIDVGEI